VVSWAEHHEFRLLATRRSAAKADCVMVPYADFNVLKFPDKEQAMEKIRGMICLTVAIEDLGGRVNLIGLSQAVGWLRIW
jgi:hypothetical protein